MVFADNAEAENPELLPSSMHFFPPQTLSKITQSLVDFLHSFLGFCSQLR